MNSISVIGGADGPTAVYISNDGWVNWFHIFGAFFVICILIPNIIYWVRLKKSGKKIENRCTNKWMNILEQIGRYGCMIFMISGLGLFDYGFDSVLAFLIYLFGNSILVLLYWIFWGFYFVKPSYRKQIALAILPSAIFLLSGITLKQWLLLGLAVIFSVAHFYVTRENRVE